MSRSIPQKCIKCAALQAPDAKALHGSDGDNCWDSTVCPARRHYIRNRDRINQQRRLERVEQVYTQLQVELPPELATLTFAVLILYRPAGDRTPLHAIGAEVWHHHQKIAEVPPIHCIGMVPSQVYHYTDLMMELLKQRYSLKGFALIQVRTPDRCPLRPCPCHPALVS